MDQDPVLARRRLLTAGAGLTAVAGATLAGVATATQVEAPNAAALQQLLDKQAIAEVLHTYPRALDRLDRDMLLSLGHPDGVVEFGKTRFDTWASFVDWLMAAHVDMLANNHRMTNMVIKVRGNRGASETTGTAFLLVANGKDQIEERYMHTRYLDSWSKRGGRWAIDKRQTLTDYRRVDTYPAAEVMARSSIGERLGRNDPSYRLFDF